MNRFVAAILLFGLGPKGMADEPEAEKQKRLAPFFSPRPESKIALLRSSISKKSKVEHIARMKGTITVTPPKGTCFSIRRHSGQADYEARNDMMVCKKTYVTWALEDLNRNGELMWEIFENERDNGTRLYWSSDYRFGRAKYPQDLPGDGLRPLFLTNCSIDEVNDIGKRLRLQLLTGERWTIGFGKSETMLKQPAPNANLTIVAPKEKSGAIKKKDPHEEPKKDEHAKAEEKPKDDHAKKDEHAPPPAASPKSSAPPKPATDSEELEVVWTMPERGAYRLAGSQFMPNGPNPPGMRGECRYSYTASAKDHDGGEIECFHVDGFAYIYLPLRCLKKD